MLGTDRTKEVSGVGMAKDFFTAEWFPYKHERFEKSDKVALMSLAEEGAYHRVIRLAWRERSLSANATVLAARIGKRCTDKIAEKVMTTFVADPDDASKIIHPIVEEIREEQHQKFLRRSKGGRASAEARKKGEPVNGANKGELNNAEYCSNNTEEYSDKKRESSSYEELREESSYEDSGESENRKAAAHSPAVAVYESIFGKAKPAFAKQIEKRVTNLALWQKLLSDKSSFDNVAGWILTAYDERVADLTPQNGRLRAGAHDAIEVFPDPNAVRKCAKCGSEYCLGGKQCEMRANGASEGEIKAAVDQATAEMLGTR